ncbi:DUF4181 domain-containing protein [Paenibacillus glycinis]|uniref:DUF4181 domain-containing protein n=1 Tax=Paenibacillus glycinis TaxID=2697035 RepID=A0ABW9XRX1_9BACL|nr:DUF4181 domain-containing protein [Paenibacillus glycinis]NBD25403.1 DUF4181 domain-containing protein [Paenibacillus glycinis]
MTFSVSNIQSLTLPLALLLMLLALTQLAVKKFILPEESNKISDTPGKNINRLVKGLLVIVTLFVFFFVLDTSNINALKWFWLLVFSVAAGQQAFMEWRYLIGSKEYMVSLVQFAVGFIYMVIFIF